MGLRGARGLHFIYASSAATYGDGSQGFRDDDSAAALAKLRPLNGYAWTKHVVDGESVDDVKQGRPAKRWAGLEILQRVRAERAPQRRDAVSGTSALRGRRGRPAGAAIQVGRRAVSGRWAAARFRVRRYCTVVQSLLAAPSVAGVFNVGTGTARSFKELALALFAAIGLEPNIEYIEMPTTLRGRYQYFTQADMSKLTSLGSTPRFHTLEEGVADYVQGYLTHEFADAGTSAAPARAADGDPRT